MLATTAATAATLATPPISSASASATTDHASTRPTATNASDRGSSTRAVRPTLPAPTGPHPIGTTEVHLVDRNRPDPWVADRPRELMISLWYPARGSHGHPTAPYFRPGVVGPIGAGLERTTGLQPGQVDWAGITTYARIGAPVGALGRRPVVVYSPGAANPRTDATMLVQELASRGYVVVTVDHTFESPAVEFPGGRVELFRPSGLDPTERNRTALRVRVEDTRFVLDQLHALAAGGNPDAEHRSLPPGLGRALDPTRVGMFGHSAGGFTTLETMLQDRRIDAGTNLDGSLGYNFATGDLGSVVAHGLDRPFLLLGAGADADGLPHHHGEAVDWRGLWEHSTGWKLDLYVPRGEHYTFTDHQAFVPQLDAVYDLRDSEVERWIGTVDPERILASQRAYVTAFFDQHLRHRPQRLLRGPSPHHPDVRFVR